MYNLPNHKVSDQLKSYNSFWIYPPLWTSRLVAMHDDITNIPIFLTFTLARQVLSSLWYKLRIWWPKLWNVLCSGSQWQIKICIKSRLPHQTLKDKNSLQELLLACKEVEVCAIQPTLSIPFLVLCIRITKSILTFLCLESAVVILSSFVMDDTAKRGG